MSVAQHLDYLVAFNRGKRISAGLGDAWMRTENTAKHGLFSMRL